jgi:metal-dependent amidase/aminoacylase/carboxypeptidase family protein
VWPHGFCRRLFSVCPQNQHISGPPSNHNSLTLHGRQGHASQPHRTIDPIVLASSTILRLQTIASREVDPSDLAVITCGSFHAGDADNIIPARADLKLDVRTIDATTRTNVLASMRRIIDAECCASNAPKAAELTQTRNFPFLVNDPDVTATLSAAFSEHFIVGPHGYDPNVVRLGGSEDFGILATAVGKPATFYTYGGIDPELWDRLEKEGKLKDDIPVNHSPYFAPVIQPTLRVAVDGYVVAALAMLKE